MVKFYADIKTTNGYLSSCIIDLNKNVFYHLSKNELTEICNGSKLTNDTLNFLTKNELINPFANNIKSFGNINLSYKNFQTPIIDSIYIEFELSWFNRLNINFFNPLRNSCHLIIDISTKLTSKNFDRLLSQCNALVANSCVDTIQIRVEFFKDYYDLDDPRILLVESKTFPLFKIELDSYRESYFRHKYYNKSIFINKRGEVKNTHKSKKVYGNVKSIKDVLELKKIASQAEFQKYWFAHKELCDVCKDCEFRHMCVDNRLPYQRKDGSWHHKIECDYNPYICKWKGEEGYKTLEECGVVSNENGFSINHEKVAAINKTLWEEEIENA